MTALWTVTVLLTVLVAVDSVAVIALTRQVGLLHLRFGQPPDSRARPGPGGSPEPIARPGPQVGTRLRLDVPRDAAGNDTAPGLFLFGFVRPACDGCTAALPAFASVASGLPGDEIAVIVSDADEAVTRRHLAGHGIALPLVTGPHVLRANGISTIPYAVVADRDGNVMAAGPATGTEQLLALLGRAREQADRAAMSNQNLSQR